MIRRDEEKRQIEIRIHPLFWVIGIFVVMMAAGGVFLLCYLLPPLLIKPIVPALPPCVKGGSML